MELCGTVPLTHGITDSRTHSLTHAHSPGASRAINASHLKWYGWGNMSIYENSYCGEDCTWNNATTGVQGKAREEVATSPVQSLWPHPDAYSTYRMPD